MEVPRESHGYFCTFLQGGEVSQDPLSLQAIFRKSDIHLAALLWKMICKLRDPVSLRHPASVSLFKVSFLLYIPAVFCLCLFSTSLFQVSFVGLCMYRWVSIHRKRTKVVPHESRGYSCSFLSVSLFQVSFLNLFSRSLFYVSFVCLFCWSLYVQMGLFSWQRTKVVPHESRGYSCSFLSVSLFQVSFLGLFSRSLLWVTIYIDGSLFIVPHESPSYSCSFLSVYLFYVSSLDFFWWVPVYIDGCLFIGNN